MFIKIHKAYIALFDHKMAFIRKHSQPSINLNNALFTLKKFYDFYEKTALHRLNLVLNPLRELLSYAIGLILGHVVPTFRDLDRGQI